MARISVPREVQKPQDYASDGTDAIGFIQFWGNSPALNLLEDPHAAAYGPAAIGTTPGSQHAKEQPNPKVSEEGCGDGEAEKDAEASDDGEGDTEGKDPVDESDLEPEPVPLLPDEGPVNILIAGGADIRHILKTVARRDRTMPGRRLRFFLHERHHEVLARHVLFLQIVNNRSIPVRERMETLLSLYGNTLVRERDSTYVSDMAGEFVDMMTDNSTHPLAGLVDLTHLKYKDRDILQDVFQGWKKDAPFDIEALREQRCRGYYRDRWDFRKNLMDFDYQNFVKEAAGIINWFHYKEFCFTGVAYETRVASYNTPNRTLASYTEAKDRLKGTTVQVRGFWGDIINSPYHAFCIRTDSEARSRLFKISGSQYRHTETDIAEFNVTGYISELETGRPFELPAETPQEHQFPYASPLAELRRAESQITEVKEEEPAAPKADLAAGGADAAAGGADSGAGGADAGAGARRRSRRAAKKTVDWPPLTPAFEDVEVVLLTGDLPELLRKPKYRGLFHRAFIGAMTLMPFIEELGLTGSGDDQFKGNGRIRRPPRHAAPDAFGAGREASSLAGAMADGALVVFETMKYQAHLEAAGRLGYRHRVAQVGHLSGWRPMDERHAVPRLESDMKDRRARELEKDSSDFVRFVCSAP